MMLSTHTHTLKIKMVKIEMPSVGRKTFRIHLHLDSMYKICAHAEVFRSAVCMCEFVLCTIQFYLLNHRQIQALRLRVLVLSTHTLQTTLCTTLTSRGEKSKSVKVKVNTSKEICFLIGCCHFLYSCF